MKGRLARVLACLGILAAGACASNAASGANAAPVVLPDAALAQAASPIRHVVIMVQENRSFDDFFATYPGADGATSGRMHTGEVVPLQETGLYGYDINHGYPDFLTAYDHGKMDGFDLLGWGAAGLAGKYAYQYVNPAQIAPYWTLAKKYVLADHMFQTQAGGSFTAHQDLIAGGTQIDAQYHLVDYPSGYIWGCDAFPGAVTSLVTHDGRELEDRGPFPCLNYATLRDLLDAKHVSWKYYCPLFTGRTIGQLWNAFDAIRVVRYGSEWKTNVSMPEKTIFSDIAAGKLPAVSWLIPDGYNSDHPQSGADTGPSWVAYVVNSIGKSKYWNSTAIVILWDDWGGFYDHVPPKRLGYGSLGFRVPAIIVSPYARAGYISHTPYEFGSILRFIEDNWGLGRLGSSDVRATSIGDAFDFTQAPLKFSPISAKYRGAFFERQPPSNRPLDDQ